MKQLLTTDAPEPAVIGEPGIEYTFEFQAPDQSSPTGLRPCKRQGFWPADRDWRAAVHSMWKFRRSVKGTPTPVVPPNRFVLYPPEPIPVQPSTRRVG